MKYYCKNIVARKIFTNHVTALKRYSAIGSVVESTGISPKSMTNIQMTELKKASQTKGLPKRPPFLKNFFVNKFDSALFTYPEAFYKDEYDKFHEFYPTIEEFYHENVDRYQIEKEGKIPVQVLQGLKDLGLFGMQISKEHGGLGLNETQCCRICEILGLDSSILLTLLAHQSLGSKGLSLFGTSAQKAIYLPRLASGELTAAFGVCEVTNGSDMSVLQATADEDQDKTSFILNGKKTWITNGGSADFFTVFAKSKSRQNDGDLISDGISAFLVERNFGGVSNADVYKDRRVLNGCNIEEVSFVNTKVPKVNVLGKLGEGEDIAMKILGSQRHHFAAGLVGLSKELLNYTIEHANKRIQFEQRLSDFFSIKRMISQMSVDIYGMESLVYMSAGLVDKYIDQDCFVELSATKVYCYEKTLKVISLCMEILGSYGYNPKLPFERSLRDVRFAAVYDGCPELIKLVVSLAGLKHAGSMLKEGIWKLRNPYLNPVMSLKKSLGFQQQSGLVFFEDLHLSLQGCADEFERLFNRFGETVEHVLTVYGAEVADPKNQMALLRLGESAIELFAIASVLSRASRSYSKGIYNATFELKLTEKFLYQNLASVQNNLDELMSYPHKSYDLYLSEIGDQVIDQGMYPAETPITKFFW